MENQGRIVASSIAELAAEKLIEEDRVGLKKILEKYRYYLSNEYILIVDAEFTPVADTYNGDLPQELRDNSVYENYDFASGQEYIRQVMEVSSPAGETVEVYDLCYPIKEGLLGFVRVGLKKSFIDDHIRTTLLYIGIIVLIGTLAAILVALAIITYQVTRPVMQLAQAAEQISLGNFDVSAQIKVKNELQILAAAIERMRESLKTSLERLKTRSTIGRF
ncbi:MAG: HAMP domain-containing protein [Calditrichaeota bacterium]|nr:MAG: HAMP domain-containing protein [Calditrichota bacterium]